MRPVIGIPFRYSKLYDDRSILYLSERVRRTIQKAGGDIFILTPVQDVDYPKTKGNCFPEFTEEEKQIINNNIDRCDGILLPGGLKFTPYDRYILEYAIKKDKPVLGICLGMQMMSCFDEEVNLEKNQTKINHCQEEDDEFRHRVIIDKNSKLYQILGQEELLVNSFHNYHATSNHIYKTIAKSEDGLIEGIEYPGAYYNIGIQWHPEISYDFDSSSKKIIDSFIEAATNSK